MTTIQDHAETLAQALELIESVLNDSDLNGSDWHALHDAMRDFEDFVEDIQ